jgi:transposase
MGISHPIRRRRHHASEFKQRLVALCQPGVSISGVALAHGVNANLLRRWINQYPACMPSRSVTVPARLGPAQVNSLIAG